MASQLIWELTKKNNCFLVKRLGKSYSTDPFNPSGKNIFSHSGLANNHVACVCASKGELKNASKATFNVCLKTKKKNSAKGANGSQIKKVICKKGVHSAVKALKGKLGRKSCLSIKKAYLLHKANVRKAAASKN